VSKPPPQHVAAFTVPATLGPGAAAGIGRALARACAPWGPVGILAMGDLSARHGPRAPRAPHPAAAAFDARVAGALARADLRSLQHLDRGLAAELAVGGLVPLQVLAGALESVAGLSGEVLYHGAPYGVGYLVGVLSA
jgi:aromatic ring-opening dioxygenase LigB subunit